jgi:propanol-preferring alcohol dehydrogenase
VSLEELGADTYIDFQKSRDVVNDVKKATADGLGPHGVILVSTSPKPFEQASEYVRPNGTVVPIGLPPGANIKASVFWGVLKMLRIKCSYVGTRRDTAEALDFFARGLIKAPYKITGLSKLQEVYHLMEKGEVAGRYVLDMSK